MFLEPGFGVNLLAWLTSTSSCPPLSTMPTWTSPVEEEKHTISKNPIEIYTNKAKIVKLCSAQLTMVCYKLWLNVIAMADI